MSVLKPYDVIVKTTAEWSGSVSDTSLRHAKQLAEQAFDDGSLSQCGEDVEAVMAFRPRKRTGSWDTFERRFEPMPAPNHNFLWDVGTVPKVPIRVTGGQSLIAMAVRVSHRASASSTGLHSCVVPNRGPMRTSSNRAIGMIEAAR
jgi:hypothetical protein